VTLQELVDKSVLQAKTGLDPQSVPTRFELVANSLLGQVFHDAAERLAGEGKTLPRLTKTLTFTDGAATLSSDVLTGFMSDAVLYDPADPEEWYTFVPTWDDFVRVYDTRLGYFTIRGGTSVYVIEPGESYEDAEGLTGTLKLVVSGVPAVPTTAGATIDAPAEFTLAAIDLMAERLRGFVREAAA
jgi:hypothetical protein